METAPPEERALCAGPPLPGPAAKPSLESSGRRKLPRARARPTPPREPVPRPRGDTGHPLKGLPLWKLANTPNLDTFYIYRLTLNTHPASVCFCHCLSGSSLALGDSGSLTSNWLSPWPCGSRLSGLGSRVDPPQTWSKRSGCGRLLSHPPARDSFLLQAVQLPLQNRNFPSQAVLHHMAKGYECSWAMAGIS